MALDEAIRKELLEQLRRMRALANTEDIYEEARKVLGEQADLLEAVIDGRGIDEATRTALLAQEERVRAVVAPIEGVARAVLDDDEEWGELRTLMRVAVEFHDYLLSISPWPRFPEDAFHNMTYMVETIFVHADWFQHMTRVYKYLEGATGSAVDWNTVTAQSLRGMFLSLYDEFVAQESFERKFRILLDLYKLELVYAGMFYDSHPHVPGGGAGS